MIRGGSGTENPCANFSFLVWGVGGIVLCCLGCTGNLLSVVALQRGTRSPTTTLLQTLAASDFVQLAAVCLIESVPRTCHYTDVCPNVWKIWPQVRFLWLLIPTAHMCSIWIAVLIAANRYWAVCRPYRAPTVWSNRRTGVYVVCVVCAVAVFNVPRFFEYRIGYGYGYAKNGTKMADNNTSTAQPYVINTTDDAYNHQIGDDGDDVIIDSESFKGEMTTEFGEQVQYTYVYKVLMVNTLLIHLPLGVLLASSVWIIRSLRVAASRSLVHANRKQDSNPTSSPGSGGGDDDNRKSSPTRQSREVTFILMTVVMVAVVCQTPLAWFHFLRFWYENRCGQVVFYLEAVSKFLLNLNACVNFVIYCVLGPKFRRLLVQALTCETRGSNRR